MTAADDAPPVWHGLLAGSVAGASGVLIGHAFDTAKVHAQIGGTPGRLKAVQLYRGIVPPLLTTGCVRSLYFGVYEKCKQRVDDSLPSTFVAAAATGLIVSPITAPVQRIKLVQQVEGGSLAQTAQRLVRASAARGLFRGLGLHCLLETIGSGCYLTAYAYAKQRFMPRRRDDHDEPPLLRRVLCGAAAGCVGWLSIYPLDVLRSRVMSAPAASASATSGGTPSAYEMVAAAVRDTYRAGGVMGFYRGLGFTLVRAAPVAGVVLPVYDCTRAWLAGTSGSGAASIGSGALRRETSL